MKVRARRRQPQKKVPVQIRVPAELHESLSKLRPKGWSLPKLIVAVLARVNADDTLVLEIES